MDPANPGQFPPAYKYTGNLFEEQLFHKPITTAATLRRRSTEVQESGGSGCGCPEDADAGRLRYSGERDESHLHVQVPAIAGAMGIDKHVDGFLRSERKIQELTTLVLAVPGSQLKFQDLNDMTSTYGRTTEAKLIHPEHFMIRAQKVMVDDASFIQQVLKDKSRITRIIKDILSGRSM